MTGTRNAAAIENERLVVALLVAASVALDLDERPIAAEHADQAIEQPANAEAPRVERRTAGERHEPGRLSVQILERQRPFALGRAQLHPRNQAAEVPIAFCVLTEHGKNEGQVRAEKAVQGLSSSLS